MNAISPDMAGSSGIALWFFVGFLAITLGLTYVAARRTRSVDDFYTAGGHISPLQNGFALAGDFIAAAAFLGLTGIISLAGSDGVLLAVSTMIGWPLMLFLFAEPLRRMGRYTFADVLAFRIGSDAARLSAGVCSALTMLLLLAMSLTGAGSLVNLLFAIPYEGGVAIAVAVMITYVLFGGMLATTWVQIIKCVLIIAITLALTFLVLKAFTFNPVDIMRAAAKRAGSGIFQSGRVFPSAVEMVSVSIGTAFAITAFPHVLMRFFTVPDAAAARNSMAYAITLVGIVFISVVVLGFGATALFGPEAIRTVERGGNMAAPMLAAYFGGPFFLGFVSAVIFATIIGTAAGMLLAGSAALAHDIWGSLRRGGSAREQMLAPKIATVGLGLAAMLLAFAFKGQNVIIIGAFAGTIPASTLFPILFLAIYWNRLTKAGAISGLVGGLFMTLVLIGLTPMVEVTLFGRATATLPYQNVTLFSMPLTFLIAAAVSLATKARTSAGGPAAFADIRGEIQT